MFEQVCVVSDIESVVPVNEDENGELPIEKGRQKRMQSKLNNFMNEVNAAFNKPSATGTKSKMCKRIFSSH